MCPATIGAFERDAVGEADPGKNTDFCAYSALDGLYGAIKLVPLNGPYSAQGSLAPDFAKTEGLGGRRVGDGLVVLAIKPQPLPVFARVYETAKLGDLRYRVMFSGAQVGNWAVETTIEYAEPRDAGITNPFLRTRSTTRCACEIGAKYAVRRNPLSAPPPLSCLCRRDSFPGLAPIWYGAPTQLR